MKKNIKCFFAKKCSFLKSFNPDRLLLTLFTKTRRHFFTRLAIFFTKIGNGQLWLLFSLIVFIYSVPNGVAFLIATMIQFYAQILIKRAIKRARPYKVYRDLIHLYDPPDPYSFPSGHTAAAFTMFFTAQIVLPFMGPFFLLVALNIAISRIYLAVHYPSDIIGGIFIGFAAARLGVSAASLVTGTAL